MSLYGLMDGDYAGIVSLGMDYAALGVAAGCTCCIIYILSGIFILYKQLSYEAKDKGDRLI